MAQQASRTWVHLHDYALPIDHQHAILHVAHHQAICLGQTGQIVTAALRQLLAIHGVFRQRMRKPSHRKIGHAQQTDLNVVCNI